MHPGKMVIHQVAGAFLALGLVLALSTTAWSAPSQIATDGDTLVRTSAAPVASARINVNTATAAELQALPGIGPKKAAAIVDYRSANGPFKRVDDLVEVKGIGPKTLSKLRSLVTCGGKARPAQAPRRAR